MMAENPNASLIAPTAEPPPGRTARSMYNERLRFNYNTDVTIIESSSRSTRYRSKKRKFLESNLKDSEIPPIDASALTDASPSLTPMPTDETLHENFVTISETFVEENQSANAFGSQHGNHAYL